MSLAESSIEHKGADREGRLELLLFSLGTRQQFGINVLKVREIVPRPRLTQLPGAHRCVIGVAELRGEVLPVLDLSLALGRGPLPAEQEGSLIVTELNRGLQAFLIGQVFRIAEREWKDVLPPPKASHKTYISGVTHVEKTMVQILDVERVLWEVIPPEDETEEALDYLDNEGVKGAQVLVVDDSSMARLHTQKTLGRVGVSCVTMRDGREALDYLKGLVGAGKRVREIVPMIISDIEMPEMDGYSLTREIRKDPQLAGLYVLLHTSLNGSISEEQAMRAGADAALTKFVAEDLARAAITGLRKSLNTDAS